LEVYWIYPSPYSNSEAVIAPPSASRSHGKYPPKSSIVNSFTAGRPERW
jgi:hypothetical protein